LLGPHIQRVSILGGGLCFERPPDAKKVEMAKHSEYFVEPHPKGWAVKLPHAERVSATAPTQKKAIERAKELAPEGVVHVKQRDGKFRRV
jgi:hypothetical protein